MIYNFLNEKFASFINTEGVNIKGLEDYINGKSEFFILKHNISALEEIIKFLNSSDNIFVLNGFMGSGKTYVADCIKDFIPEEVLLFRNYYQEAINLDDVLLSLFKDFSNYHNERKCTLPKLETNVFSEKINAYIKACDKPMLFIFDSFEINMCSKDTQNDILDFLNFLSKFSKIKIIICSRTFKETDLIISGSSQSLKLESLTRDEVNDYLTENSIEKNSLDVDEFYKLSRGHYLLSELSVMIMTLLGYSLASFLEEYKKSQKNFFEYIISKILSVSSDRFIKLMTFLTVIRHGISLDFIVNQNLAEEDDIIFLMQKHVVSSKYGKYYLKDYIKTEFIKKLSPDILIKMHKYLIEIYEAELPLKPFDRQLFLSRLTMRQEIEFHKNKSDFYIEETEKTTNAKSMDLQEISYMTYVRTSGYGNKNDKSNDKKRIIDNSKLRIQQPKRQDMSSDDILLFNSINKKDSLENQMEAISGVVDYSKNQSNKTTDESIFNSVPENINDYISIGKKCVDSYNYSDAVLYYRKALTYKNDENFNELEPKIYISIAKCYEKIQDIEQASLNYEKAYKIYAQSSQDKANDVLLRMAQMYAQVFKYDKAKEIYNRILSLSNGLSNDLTVKIYLNLSDIESSNSKYETADKYLQTAINTAEKSLDAVLISECYYKYALFFDYQDNIETAAKYYLRCVQVSADAKVNKNLSSAYSNLAEISLENNNISAAKMYYELSVEADSRIENNDGLYYSYTKLAEIHRKEKSPKTLDYLIQALTYAKKSDDITRAVSAYVKIGDYHMEKRDYSQGIKSYILAKTIAPSDIAENIQEKLNIRLNKLKLSLGETEYNKLLENIKNNN